MTNLEPAAAATVVALATLQIYQAWNATAPSLAELRSTDPDRASAENVGVRQKLMDADVTIGFLALLVGVGMSVYTRNMTVLLLMICTFGGLSLWHHSVLASTPNYVRMNY